MIIIAGKMFEIKRNIATDMSTTGRENTDFISHIYCDMIFKFNPPRNLGENCVPMIRALFPFHRTSLFLKSPR